MIIRSRNIIKQKTPKRAENRSIKADPIVHTSNHKSLSNGKLLKKLIRVHTKANAQ